MCPLKSYILSFSFSTIPSAYTVIICSRRRCKRKPVRTEVDEEENDHPAAEVPLLDVTLSGQRRVQFLDQELISYSYSKVLTLFHRL